jgi:pimeloyl-ACP methyl ester carboxylesterase
VEHGIVYLHGMAGGHLVSPDDGRLAWLSTHAILRGEVGSGLDIARRLDPAGHVKLFHRPASLYWRVSRGIRVWEFAYDWRLSLDNGARLLAQLIAGIPSDLPLRLVAHSMGGCVACRWSSLFPEVCARRVERAFFLGVPVHGSFAAVQVLRGEFGLQKALSLAAFGKSRRTAIAEMRDACVRMPGVVDLLPDPARFPSAHRLYDTRAWPTEAAPTQELLDRSLALKAAMPQSPILERTTVLASGHWPTEGDAGTTVAGDGVTTLISARAAQAADYVPLHFPHAFLMLEPKAIRLAARFTSVSLP